MPRLLAPRYWGAHLLALVAVGPAAVLLGGWQYDAWQERRAAEARGPDPAASRSRWTRRSAPTTRSRATGSASRSWSRARWVPDGTVLVSGREHDGRGRLLGGDAGRDRRDRTGRRCRSCAAGRRARTTYPAPPTGATELVGWLQPPEGTGEADPDPADDVLPQLRIADLVQRVDQDLYGAYAVVARNGPAATTAPTGSSRPTLEQLPDVGRVHRRPQPALRDRVVVLRGVRRCSSGGAGCGTTTEAERGRAPMTSRGRAREPLARASRLGA